MKTFLLAGHETSAAMLMWSVYELSRHPQQRDKVRG
jgi:cytochrome P450